MGFIYLARHRDFILAEDERKGMPIVREMPSQTCMDQGLVLDYYGLRHFTFTPDLTPILATALKCCDRIDGCPRVETDCIDGIGIDPHVILHAFPVENCNSAHRRIVELTYCKTPGFGEGDCEVFDCADPPPDPPPGCTTCDLEGKGKWTGGLSLRGGTITFEMCCFRDINDDLQFRLLWRGCDEGCVEVFPDCIDPLFVNFGNITIDNCCDCNDSTESGTINLFLTANCYPTVWGRHTHFEPNGIPVISRESTCAWSGDPPVGCLPHCGLVASITNVTDCSCLAGTYLLNYTSTGSDAFWDADDLSTACAVSPMTTFRLRCTDNEDGTVTLELDIVCGTTNISVSDPVVVAYEDMEDLDVTFNLEMQDSSAGSSCGTCTYQWNEMPMSWSLIADNCTGACSCSDPPAEAGDYDGEQRAIDCGDSYTIPCCIGEISVRVMR